MITDLKAPRFFVDPTVCRLGKWLRYLGLDVPFARSEKNLPPDGILITKKRKIRKKEEHIVSIPFDRIEDQLSWFISHFPFVVDPWKIGSRCIRCNQILSEIPREGVRNRVPDYIFQTHTSFKICPKCHGIYWKGSHPDRMRTYLEKIGIFTKDES